VRWRHPIAASWLPTISSPSPSNMADRNDRLVRLERGLPAARRVDDRDDWPAVFTMAVNVSGAELSDPHFADRVANVIASKASQPGGSAWNDRDRLRRRVGDVQTTLSRSPTRRASGSDDFGTGYSSLAHLQRMKVDI